MSKCLIISGGEYSRIKNPDQYNFIIACDKGYEYAMGQNIVPDVVLGDFDSYDGEVREDLNKQGGKSPELMTFPVEKDDTDTMLAIKLAIEKGYRDITIVCALGGRLDHTISNIQSMAYAASHGGRCEIISDNERLIVYPEDKGNVTEVDIEKGNDSNLSLFALSDRVTNLTVKGAKYEADNIELTNSFPLGVSNSFCSRAVKISWETGLLLIVLSKVK